MQTEIKCPKCNSPMKFRKGKFGDFYGCSSFPKCRHTMPANGIVEKKDLRRIKTPSTYQANIFDWVAKGEGHAVIKATAGSGKTTVQEHICALLLEDMKVSPEDVIYLAFNSHVVKEAVEKGLPARSTHQVGLATISAHLGKKVKVDDTKVGTIVKSLIQQTWDTEKWMIAPVCNIVSKVKNTLAPTDNATLEKICDKFGIEVNGSSERIFDLVRATLAESNKNLSVIDFDDMLYLPNKFKMPVSQYKWVLGDEIQDWNRAQIELIKKLVAPGGQVIAVGDENQSMYGFRGASPDAMSNIQQAFNATVLPLSISYRNPASHVDLINQVFPEIAHEKSPFAKQGDIVTMSYDKMLGSLMDGDLVICRNNAPLVEPVFSLIRQGVKAVIRGRDIGKGLANLIERFNVKSTNDLVEKIVAYRAKEVAKLLKAEKTSQADALDDKVETILVLAEGCEWVWEVTQKINEVFSDKREGVIFSTVHRAKGDEAERVFILKPQLMPSKYAKNEEQIQQEKNILFVALSRSKDFMAFVAGPAPSSFESQGMWEDDKTEQLVIEQLTERLPEGTKIFTNVEVTEDTVKFEKEIIVKKEVPNCPF